MKPPGVSSPRKRGSNAATKLGFPLQPAPAKAGAGTTMGSRFRGNDTSEFERHRRFHASRVARSAVEQLK